MVATLASCLVTSWLVEGPVAPATAQGPAENYRIIPINATAQKDRTLRSDVLKTFRAGDISGDGQFGDEEKKRLQTYYWGLSLPRWTLPEFRTELAGNPEQLEETTRGLRVELQNELRNCNSKPAFEFVTGLLLKSMENLVRQFPAGDRNFHPATRVNAMLMIGELGAKPPESFGEVPPPLPAALPILLNHLRDPEQIDAVKVAALVGINRHAELGGIQTPQARQAVVTTLVALLNSPQPPDRSSDGHAWLRSQAAEILGKLGIAAAGVPEGLTAMVADTGLPVSIRCVGAEALGKLNLAGATNLAPARMVGALARLADAAIARELAKKDYSAEPSPPATIELPSDELPPGTSGVGTGPELSRRRLKAALSSVAQGLKGLGPVAGQQRELYVRVSRPVAAILADLDDRRIKDEELMAKIRENHKQLRAALGTAPEPAAPVEPPAET
jgi:hypothetical protein